MTPVLRWIREPTVGPFNSAGTRSVARSGLHPSLLPLLTTALEGHRTWAVVPRTAARLDYLHPASCRRARLDRER